MKKSNGLGTASLVLGIIGVLLSCVFIGVVPAIIGLILGIVGLCKKDKSKGTAIAGTVCSAIGVVIFLIVIASAGNATQENKAEKVGEIEVEEAEKPQEEEKSNIFNVGDVVETEGLRITFISSETYFSDNQFIQPKDGYEYWKFEFKFENISDTDKSVSSMMDWECYADNSKVDQTYIGDDNGLDATLSAGRTTQGAVYFEVPIDAKSIELEYDINFWKSDKIIFVGK